MDEISSNRNTSKVDLKTSLGPRFALVNPVMNASGVGGFSTELSGYLDLRELGAFVTKSLATFETKGNPAPRVSGAGSAMINSVGLTGPGIKKWRENHLAKLDRGGVTTVVSIWGRSIDDYQNAIQDIDGVDGVVKAIEINVSCPNIEDRNRMFAHSTKAVAEVLDATEGANLPRFIKLSPNTHLLGEIVDVAVEKGVDGVVLINTVMGMAIDYKTLLPSLGAKGGGLSGPAVHQVALRAIYETYARYPNLPIIGVGGVSNARDVVALAAAGASAIEIGTASFVDPKIFSKVLTQLPIEMKEIGFVRFRDLVGASHRGGIAALKLEY
ncbi:MAG: dihydroorotate dehydrogenase [Actinomycetota bacterium]|nr:dihydroorotate dehydrogenase [Actinomycetota bacterium]